MKWLFFFWGSTFFLFTRGNDPVVNALHLLGATISFGLFAILTKWEDIE